MVMRVLHKLPYFRMAVRLPRQTDKAGLALRRSYRLRRFADRDGREGHLLMDFRQLLDQFELLATHGPPLLVSEI